MSPDKLKRKIQQWQTVCFIVFVPTAGIAIFSDNGMFETIALIASIVFTTLMIIESKMLE